VCLFWLNLRVENQVPAPVAQVAPPAASNNHHPVNNHHAAPPKAQAPPQHPASYQPGRIADYDPIASQEGNRHYVSPYSVRQSAQTVIYTSDRGAGSCQPFYGHSFCPKPPPFALFHSLFLCNNRILKKTRERAEINKISLD